MYDLKSTMTEVKSTSMTGTKDIFRDQIVYKVIVYRNEKLSIGIIRNTKTIKSFIESSFHKFNDHDKTYTPLEEKVDLIKDKVSKMSLKEKWEIVEKSFGMWSDYPDNWLSELRAGNLASFEGESSETEYEIFSGHDSIS